MSVIDLKAGTKTTRHRRRRAPLAPRGDRDRPEGGPRLRGGRERGHGRGDRHEEDGGRARRCRSSARRAPAPSRRRSRHGRRLPAARGRLRRGRDRRVRPAAPAATRSARPPASRAKKKKHRRTAPRRKHAGRASPASRWSAAAAAKAQAFQLIGRVPVALLSRLRGAPPHRQDLVWVAAKGLGVGPNPNGPNPLSPNDTDDADQQLPVPAFDRLGRRPAARAFPTDARAAHAEPEGERADPAGQRRARRRAGTPLAPGGPIKHVFYIVRENRTYDQVLGDDPRGDGDPNLALLGGDLTPNAHALARRFPLLDHVYANSEASIDGHFWTSAGAVSDYVVKNWHQNYAGARAALRLRRLRRHLARQAVPVRRGPGAGHLVLQLRRGDRRARSRSPTRTARRPSSSR